MMGGRTSVVESSDFLLISRLLRGFRGGFGIRRVQLSVRARATL